MTKHQNVPPPAERLEEDEAVASSAKAVAQRPGEVPAEKANPAPPIQTEEQDDIGQTDNN